MNIREWSSSIIVVVYVTKWEQGNKYIDNLESMRC